MFMFVCVVGPCEIDDIVEKYNLQLPKEKVYIRHAEKYRLNCRDGWNTGSEMKTYVDVSCSNGNLQIDKSCEYNCFSLFQIFSVYIDIYVCLFFCQVIYTITENNLDL